MKRVTLLLLALLSSVNAFADLTTMNASELKAFDGKNGHKAYVALNGYVYDVSNVDEWRGGKHYKGQVAGVDLTPNIGLSPHGIGIIQDEKLKPVAKYKP